MSIISDIESKLSGDAKTAWSYLVAEEKYLASMIYKDATAALGAVESVVLAALPGAVQELKQYALTCVKSLEANPQFKNALGQWKFGVVCAQILQVVESGFFPGALAIVKTLGTATIETAVQAAVAAMIAGA